MPLPVTHPNSPHHIALYAALLCSQNTLSKVKKAMMLIVAEPETLQNELTFTQALSDLCQQSMMYQEGNKLWFTPQGLTQALLVLSGVVNRQLEDLVESNIDNPKAPYVGLFAVASDYDWLMDLSYELNNP